MMHIMGMAEPLPKARTSPNTIRKMSRGFAYLNCTKKEKFRNVNVVVGDKILQSNVYGTLTYDMRRMRYILQTYGMFR
jgi:hypothetical protein